MVTSESMDEKTATTISEVIVGAFEIPAKPGQEIVETALRHQAFRSHASEDGKNESIL